jgi:hypothetical protein
MKYARFVLGYHGCTQDVADQLLVGRTTLTASTNTWDWLGHGIYFWEFGHQRALDWARSNSDRPAVIGAVIQLVACLDLLDTQHTELLGVFTRGLVEGGQPLPPNRGGRLEANCFAINQLCDTMTREGKPFDSVRASFHEGDEVFPGSNLRHQSHIQIAVRDPVAILGLFKPNDRSTQ